MGKFYDGAPLLGRKDINGNRPEIFMVTTNRTGGKTTYFQRMLAKKFLENGQKFALLYRFKNELKNCADNFWMDIGPLFFPDIDCFGKTQAEGLYHTIIIDGKLAGYAMAINGADSIKKQSKYFSDVDYMFMDEFQSETNHYCPEEIRKFICTHVSVARGRNQFVRHVPVFMAANPVTLLNPYYVSMGIASRLRNDTKFLRGPGFVCEQGYVEGAAEAQQQSGFMQAFQDNPYVLYSKEGIYLDNNQSFIEKPTGKSRYIATVGYRGKEYAIREFPEYMYIDTKVDQTFRYKLALTTADHKINYIMLQRNALFIANLRYFYNNGLMRFRNIEAKDAGMNLLAYGNVA